MKKLIVVCLLFTLFFNSTAQEVEPKKLGYREFQSWSVEAMGGIFLPLNYNLSYYNFGVYPRYNFAAPKDYLSVSAGFPLNFGFNFFGSNTGTIIQLMTDVPITVDVNFGARATPYNESLFGAYLGAGFDYNFMNFTYGSFKIIQHTFGPTIHGGLKWTFNGRDTGIRISYTSGFGTADEVVNGIIVAGESGNKILSFSLIYGIK